MILLLFLITVNAIILVGICILKTPNLNSGEEFTVSGVSEIHFDGGLVRYHRDYFDMGEFIYERLPVFGRIVRLIKERLEYKE